MELAKYDIGVHVIAIALCSFKRLNTSRQKLRLIATPTNGFGNRVFNKLGQGLGVSKQRFNSGTELRLNADGRQSRGFHDPTVSRLRCKVQRTFHIATM